MSDSKRKHKPALSVSQIKRYLQCPAKWKYRYRDKLPEDRGVPLIYGSAIHDALAFHYDRKIAGVEPMPVERVIGVFVSNLSVYRQELGAEFLPVLREGANLLRMYMRDVAPNINPILCEPEFDIDLGADFPFRFIGKIDLVDEGAIIRDHKVVSKLPTQAEVDSDIQLSGYATAYRIQFGERERGLSFDFLLKGKCEFHRIETARTDAQCREFLDLLSRIAGKILREEFEPNPDHWLCQPQFCSYYSQCPGPLQKDAAVAEDVVEAPSISSHGAEHQYG